MKNIELYVRKYKIGEFAVGMFSCLLMLILGVHLSGMLLKWLSVYIISTSAIGFLVAIKAKDSFPIMLVSMFSLFLIALLYLLP